MACDVTVVTCGVVADDGLNGLVRAHVYELQAIAPDVAACTASIERRSCYRGPGQIYHVTLEMRVPSEPAWHAHAAHDDLLTAMRVAFGMLAGEARRHMQGLRTADALDPVQGADCRA